MTTENFLFLSIRWLIIATLFMPLIISDSTLFPYVTGKAIAFQVLVEISFIFYLWLVYLNKKRTGGFDYLPRFNPLSISLLVFLGVLVLNNIFSVDPYYSFWSKQERMEGLFNLFHFFLFFFIIISTIKNNNDWFKLLNISLAVSFVITLYAFGQKFGWFFNPYGDRVTGTLGNAAFLGTYLLFNIFFAFYLLFLFAKKNWQKIIYSIVIGLEIIALILTQTRGAIYGLITGITLFSLGYIFFEKRGTMKKYAFLVLVILLMMIGGLIYYRNTDFVKRNPILYRITDISFSVGTGRIRLISWQGGLRAFMAKPIFGWGEENYYVAFNKYVDPIFFFYSGETFDRAHNKMIDLLVMNGILGFGAYLVIFILAIIFLWRERKGNPLASNILISLLGAYFFQNLMLFDMPTSYLMFFLSLGIIHHVTTKPILPSTKKSPKKDNKSFLKYGILFLTFLTILFLWSGNLKPLSASQKCIRGQQLINAQNKNEKLFKTGLENFKEAIEAQTFVTPEVLKTLAPLVVSSSEIPQYPVQLKKEALEYAASQIEKGLEKMPYFLDYYLYLTDIYNTLGNQDKTYYSKAENVINKAIELYPPVPYIYYKLIVNRLAAGDYNKAVEVSQRAIALNPRLAQNYWYLGISQFYAGNLQTAKEATEKALEIGYSYNSNLANVFYLAQLYEKLKEYQKAIILYEEIVKQRPSDYDIMLALARNYKEIGELQKAKEFAQKIYKEAPESQAKEAAQLLVGLEFSSQQ